MFQHPRSTESGLVEKFDRWSLRRHEGPWNTHFSKYFLWSNSEINAQKYRYMHTWKPTLFGAEMLVLEGADRWEGLLVRTNSGVTCRICSHVEVMCTGISKVNKTAPLKRRICLSCPLRKQKIRLQKCKRWNKQCVSLLNGKGAAASMSGQLAY